MKSIWINNNIYSLEAYASGNLSLNDLPEFQNKIISLAVRFLLGTKIFSFRTSGSTGESRKIDISRERMVASAEMTLKYLKIYPGANVLLCLNPDYIAGAMMIVRAITGKLNLFAVDPVANPLQYIPEKVKFDLCSMVPLQLKEVIGDKNTVKKMEHIKSVLIGGAPMDPVLIRKSRELKPQIFLTFGMTETVSHIAMQKINGPSNVNYFEALPGIILDRDERGCLIINGPVTGNLSLVTNDLVELLDENRFIWKGRIDHVINSGGVKLVVEELEKKIRMALNRISADIDFFLAGVPDHKLGERLCIVVEMQNNRVELNKIKNTLKKVLDIYEFPREWRVAENFIRTGTQKVNRPDSLANSDSAD